MKTVFNLPTRSSFLGLMFVAATLMLASSCKKDDGYQFDGSVTAKVQLVNASADAGSVSLYIDNILRTPNAVAYGSASGYNNAYTGQQDVTVQNATGNTLATLSSQIDAANVYTYILAGAGTAQALIAVNDDQTAPASGKARIRFVQASSNAATLSLIANGTALFSGINYKAASAYMDVAAGSYTFKLANASTTLFTSTTISLTAGKIYTIYSKGQVEGSGNAALGIGVVNVN